MEAKQSTDSSTLAVGGVILGGLATLYLLRRGLRGIGDLQLTGSALSAVEWAAYAAVVGGTLRVAQTAFPDNKVVQALGFVY